jgi:hypothetical protein
MVKPHSILLLAGLALAQQCPPSIQIDHKPQIFVSKYIGTRSNSYITLPHQIKHHSH